MKEAGIKKIPGQSWTTDKNGIVRTFYMDDYEHQDIENIHVELDKLRSEATKLGYSPDVSCVLHPEMTEKEKLTRLWKHSEKLAIAFSLLDKQDKLPIIVRNNLRMCADCHQATKFISKIRNVPIVVRDANRNHCFESGSCSCKDYY